jgi:hypothetical protein
MTVVVAEGGRGWWYSPNNTLEFKAKARREHDSQAVMAAVLHPPATPVAAAITVPRGRDAVRPDPPPL